LEKPQPVSAAANGFQFGGRGAPSAAPFRDVDGVAPGRPWRIRCGDGGANLQQLLCAGVARAGAMCDAAICFV